MEAAHTETFDTLYQRHAAVVRRAATAILRNELDVEDVVQDVFLRAWLGFDRFDAARGTHAAWLTVMARSRALDRVRARARTASATDVDGMPETLPDAFMSMLWSERAGALRPAFLRLSGAQQHLLSLVYHDGLSHSRIASLLGMPVGTVKTRIRAAVCQLRSCLSGNGEDTSCATESAQEVPACAPFTVSVAGDQAPIALSLLSIDHATQEMLCGLHVLVVDDDEETLKLIAAVLARYDAHAHAFPSARGALSAMERAWPDVMIVDLDMPGHDGYDLLADARAAARRRQVRLPAVAFTGRCSEEERSRTVLAGFDAYLTKPIHPLAVLSTVAALARSG